MGMAASQARLLSITSRLSDNELRAQLINNQKIRLATESSNASDAYVSALNDAQMMYTNYDADNNKSYQQLTFNALTAYNPYNNQYGLSNSNGLLLVSEKDAHNFASVQGKGDDLTEFLKLYGLEHKTTFFDDDGILSKYLDNGKVTIPDDTLESGRTSSIYGKEYSIEDLKKLYEGDNGIHVGYNNIPQDEMFMEFDKKYETYMTAKQDVIDAAAPSLSTYINNAKNGQVTMDNILNLVQTLEDTNNKGEIPTGNLGKLNDYMNAFAGLIEQMGKTLDKSGKGNETDGYFKKTADLIRNYTTSTTDVSTKIDLKDSLGNTTYSIIPVTSVDGKTLLAYDTKTNKFAFFTGTSDSDGNFDTSSLTFDHYLSGTETKSTTEEVTNEDGTTSSKTHTTTYTVSGNSVSATDDDGRSSKYTYASNGSGGYTETYEADITMNYIENFIKSVKSQFYKEYQNYVDYMSLISDEQRDYLADDNESKDTAIFENKMKNTVFDTTNLNDTLKTKTQEIAIIYAKALQKYEEASKELSKRVFGSEVDKSQYEYLEDLAFLVGSLTDEKGKAITPKGTNGAKLNYREEVPHANFNSVIDFNVLETVFNIYGEPKFDWVDTQDPSNPDPTSKAEWYTNLFNRMKKGYSAIQDGLASSTEWIKFALQNGLVSMEQVDAGKNWNSFEYGSCSDITEQTDSAAVTKAEAEYNQKMNKIQAKDQRYDLELKNIDTEHTSLQTEYESIKSVIDKNIERTFKIYS